MKFIEPIYLETTYDSRIKKIDSHKKIGIHKKYPS